TQPLGRYDASGRFTAYWDRAQIEDGALAGPGLELAGAADPAELFFLQVQGSGRLRAPDGTVIRIGYAGENGWPYTGIGQVMRQQ
ncbi:MltA domain-containing protein, partial [Acinetobacter baumannii]